jgi:hypothetical protein
MTKKRLCAAGGRRLSFSLSLSPAAETHAAKRELCARGRFGFKMLNCATALILPG